MPAEKGPDILTDLPGVRFQVIPPGKVPAALDEDQLRIDAFPLQHLQELLRLGRGDRRVAVATGTWSKLASFWK